MEFRLAETFERRFRSNIIVILLLYIATSHTACVNTKNINYFREVPDMTVKGAAAVPPSAQKLVAYLNQKSPKNLSDPDSLK